MCQPGGERGRRAPRGAIKPYAPACRSVLGQQSRPRTPADRSARRVPVEVLEPHPQHRPAKLRRIHHQCRFAVCQAQSGMRRRQPRRSGSPTDRTRLPGSSPPARRAPVASIDRLRPRQPLLVLRPWKTQVPAARSPGLGSQGTVPPLRLACTRMASSSLGLAIGARSPLGLVIRRNHASRRRDVIQSFAVVVCDR